MPTATKSAWENVATERLVAISLDFANNPKHRIRSGPMKGLLIGYAISEIHAIHRVLVTRN